MRISAVCTAVLTCAVIGPPPPAIAQIDQQRAQGFFKECQALHEHDGGRLWGVSFWAPMVIGDARTQTFATSQPPPEAPRPKIIGLLNGPIQWGDAVWAAVTWDTFSNWPVKGTRSRWPVVLLALAGCACSAAARSSARVSRCDSIARCHPAP